MNIHLPWITALKWQFRSTLESRRNKYRMRHSPDRGKVFCIGLNKTGTTSWTLAMKNLGYVVGSETKATMYFDDWARGDFHRIIEYCRHEGEAFQDIPFSLPATFREMDRAFPGSKFVLTIRESPEQWYRSIIRFHSKSCSASGNVPPTLTDLLSATYWRKGFLAEYCRKVLGTPADDPYDRQIVLDFYRTYNQGVQDYFAGRPDSLLVINVAKNGEHNRLTRFLGVPPGSDDFPWENKT